MDNNPIKSFSNPWTEEHDAMNQWILSTKQKKNIWDSVDEWISWEYHGDKHEI